MSSYMFPYMLQVTIVEFILEQDAFPPIFVAGVFPSMAENRADRD